MFFTLKVGERGVFLERDDADGDILGDRVNKYRRIPFISRTQL